MLRLLAPQWPPHKIYFRLVAKKSKKSTIYMKVLWASVARPLIFDPDAGLPRINRGMVYLDY